MYNYKPIDDNEKLRTLNEKWVSPTNVNFPVIAGRKYNPQWENEHTWLHYSINKYAAYCVHCMLFGNKLSKPENYSMVFQHSGFTDWIKSRRVRRW